MEYFHEIYHLANIEFIFFQYQLLLMGTIIGVIKDKSGWELSVESVSLEIQHLCQKRPQLRNSINTNGLS